MVTFIPPYPGEEIFPGLAQTSIQNLWRNRFCGSLRQRCCMSGGQGRAHRVSGWTMDIQRPVR